MMSRVVEGIACVLMAAVLVAGCSSNLGSSAAKPVAGGQEQVMPPKAPQLWTCPMHPQVQVLKPGKCPICGMDLVPAKGSDVAVPILQKTCPVMAGPINKNIFADYKGRRVYFCCSDCVAAFNKDPEKYIAKVDEELKAGVKNPAQ